VRRGQNKVNKESGNIFEFPPGGLDQEAFETLLEGDHVRVERIVSGGQTSPADFWYDQAQGEWVLVLKGAAIVRVEGKGDHHLSAGGFLNLPAHTRHRVEWTDPDTETVWLAIHY